MVSSRGGGGGPIVAPGGPPAHLPVNTGGGTPVHRRNEPGFDYGAWLRYLTGPPKPSSVNELVVPRIDGIPQAGDRVPVLYGEQLVPLVVLLSDTADRYSANFLLGACMGECDSLVKLFCNDVDVTNWNVGIPNGGIEHSFWPGTSTGFTDTWVDAALLARGVTPHTGPYAPNVAAIRVHIWSDVTNMFGGPGKWTDKIPGGESAGLKFTAIIRGRKVYDPRTGLTVYAKNPALISRDLLTNTTFGARLPSGRIDDVSFGAAADDCDATIGSPAQTRFEYAGLISSPTNIKSVLDAVRLTMNGDLFISGGKVKLFVDIENAGDPVVTLDSRYNLANERFLYPTTKDSPTRVTVEFPNAATDFKLDTVTIDHPLLATGGVELREAKYRSEGTSDSRRARRIATYVLNRATFAQSFSGDTTFAGILRERGDKVRVKSSKGIDAPFILDEAHRAGDGLWSLVGRVYDASIYGESAVTITHPVVNPPPDPGIAGPDVTVTDDTLEKSVFVSSDSNSSLSHVFQVIEFTVPDAGGATLSRLAVRGIRDAAALSKTWADLVDTEVSISLLGNEPSNPADALKRRFFLSQVVKTLSTSTFDQNGRVSALDLDTGPTRIMIRTETTAGAQSAGVTIDVAHTTSHTDYPPVDYFGPLIVAPYGTHTGDGGEIRLKELAANGTNYTGFTAPDSLAADVPLLLPATAPADGQRLQADASLDIAADLGATPPRKKKYGTKWTGGPMTQAVLQASSPPATVTFAVPHNFVAGTLIVVKDGQFCVGDWIGTTPRDGYDYSLSGLNVTFAIAPSSFVLFIYEKAA